MAGLERYQYPTDMQRQLEKQKAQANTDMVLKALGAVGNVAVQTGQGVEKLAKAGYGALTSGSGPAYPDPSQDYTLAPYQRVLAGIQRVPRDIGTSVAGAFSGVRDFFRTPTQEEIAATQSAANQIPMSSEDLYRQAILDSLGGGIMPQGGGGGMATGGMNIPLGQVPVSAPQMAQVPAMDFSKINDYLEQSAPVAPQTISKQERFANILAGLAGGAAGADTNNIGALLASIGAGGLGTLAKIQQTERTAQDGFAKEQQGYNKERAEAEFTQQQQMQAEKQRNAEIDFENKKLQDDYLQFLQSDIKFVGNNMVITSVDKKTGERTAKVLTNPGARIATSRALGRRGKKGEEETGWDVRTGITSIEPAEVMAGRVQRAFETGQINDIIDPKILEVIRDQAREEGNASGAMQTKTIEAQILNRAQNLVLQYIHANPQAGLALLNANLR